MKNKMEVTSQRREIKIKVLIWSKKEQQRRLYHQYHTSKRINEALHVTLPVYTYILL